MLVQGTESGLSQGELLLGGAAEPLGRAAVVLLQTFAPKVHQAEVVLRESEAPLCCNPSAAVPQLTGNRRSNAIGFDTGAIPRPSPPVGPFGL